MLNVFQDAFDQQLTFLARKAFKVAASVYECLPDEFNFEDDKFVTPRKMCRTEESN